MTEREIVAFGSPVLRKECSEITRFDADLIALLEEMAEVLYGGEGRAGLAAPQIGISQKVVVIDCGDGLIELINPVILESDGEQVGEEACLSYPGYVGVVKRADYVRVRSFDRDGNEFEMDGTGFLARCFQHEIDHLNGILYVDRIVEDQLYDDNGRKVDVAEVVRMTKA